jgi:tetratricopeptide (TPR) repeat protein
MKIHALLIDADIILDRLSGLPLALTQAGSYMQETNISASAYAEHYDSTWERLMQRQSQFPLQEYGDRNVLTTWSISYEQVQKQSGRAVWLLKLWGFLDNGELWYELVAAGSQLSKSMDTPRWVLEIAEDELAYAEAVGLLARYSLADAREGSNSHSMHSVLHQWCGRLAEGEERYFLGCIAAGIVALNVPSELEAEFWRMRKRLLAHAVCVTGWVVDVYVVEGEAGRWMIQAWLYYRLAYLIVGEDRLKEGEFMYKRALRGYEKALGAEHTSTLDTVNNLGLLYANQGRLDKAEAMYERALRGKEKALGAEHTSTLGTVNNLGSLYADQGRLDKAEAMYERALRGREKVLGAEHTSTLDTVNNLGLLYKKQERLDKAEAMYERALRGEEKALGAEYKSTLGTVNNLGSLYACQGRLDKAEAMYERALRGTEKALGAEHTSTLGTVNNLGLLYADQGRLDKAEAMYERALRGYEKATKPENLSIHIPTLNTIWNLASLYDRHHRVEEARVLYLKALSGFENVMGSDHRKCHSLRSSLAALGAEQDEVYPLQAEVPVNGSSKTPPAGPKADKAKPVSKRYRFFDRIRRKER